MATIAWPVYYSDQYGDCTCAAAGHMIRNWTANAATEITPPDQSVLTFYDRFAGSVPWVVSSDFIGTSGEPPGGFDLAALKRDLAQL